MLTVHELLSPEPNPHEILAGPAGVLAPIDTPAPQTASPSVIPEGVSQSQAPAALTDAKKGPLKSRLRSRLRAPRCLEGREFQAWPGMERDTESLVFCQSSTSPAASLSQPDRAPEVLLPAGTTFEKSRSKT